MACGCSENAGETILLEMSPLAPEKTSSVGAAVRRDFFKRLKALVHYFDWIPQTSLQELLAEYSSPIRSKNGASASEKALAADYRAKEEALIFCARELYSFCNRLKKTSERAKGQFKRPESTLRLGTEVCATCFTTVSTSLYASVRFEQCPSCVRESYFQTIEKDHPLHEFLDMLTCFSGGCTCPKSETNYHKVSDCVRIIDDCYGWLQKAPAELENAFEEIKKRLAQNRETYNALLESEELKGRIAKLKSRKEELSDLQKELARVEAELKRLDVE